MSARRWNPPRRLKFTREGKYFVGVTLGVGFAAINTANNLLYLVLGLQLSLIVLSGILSELALRDINIERRLPMRAQAGQTFLVEISLHNRKHRVPSYSVEVEDILVGRATEKRCYFLKVAPQGTQTAAYRCSLPRRGAYTFRGFRLSTRFPFGLFEKSREVAGEDELVILPRLLAVRAPIAAAHSELGEQTSGRPGVGTEFYGLRGFRPGDAARDVHWKTSARRDELLVRETEAERGREVLLALDNARPAGAPDPQVEAAMEEAVSVAASLATDFITQGAIVHMAVRGELRGPASDRRGLEALLRFLALVPIVELKTAPPWPAGMRPGLIGIAHRRSSGVPGQGPSFRCG